MDADEEFRRALAADASVPYVPREIIDLAEHDFSSRIRKMVDERQLYGFTSYDFRHRYGPGFPDWVIGGPGGIIFRELKSTHGELSKDQRRWSVLLRFHGHDFAVWRPVQLGDGTIARELDEVLGPGWVKS